MIVTQNVMSRDYAAFLAKLGGAASPGYEKRNAPGLGELAETIGQVAEGFEEHKRIVAELRRRLDQTETRMARPGAMLGSAGAAAAADDFSSVQPPTREERDAFRSLLRTGDSRYAREARAAVNAGTSGQGLEAVAPWFDNTVLRMARDATPLLGLVRIRQVSAFPAKHIVGSGGAMGSGWVSEQGNRSDTDPPLPLVVEVPAGEWWALPAVTEWALSDLNFDVESWLSQELADEFSETMMAAIVGGNGTSKPKGFLDGTPVTTADGMRAFGTVQYLPTGQAATMPTTTSGMIDLLLDVVHRLRWKHRQNASWLMNAVTMSTLRKFKDADGRPILLDSMVSGQPTKLLGYPVAEVESMPSITANAFPIAFGDFDAGYILDMDSAGMRITRDDITTKGFVKYYARRRVSGKVLDSEAIKLVKVAAS